MNVEEFCRVHGGGARPIDDVVRSWREQQIDRLLHEAVAAGVLVTDLGLGDGFRDQISPELLEGFATLGRTGSATSYQDVRETILQALERGDRSVQGLVSKIKGQIGENRFIEEVGPGARLAASGSQAGWDVAVDRADGTQYVQVKMYGDPDGVLAAMREVSARARSGDLVDGEQIVPHVDFAVPGPIAEEVARKAAADPALASIEVLPIGTTATEAAQVVEQGVANVGPDALQHLFGELFGPAVTAGALHAAVNAFLVYKQAKDESEAIADTLLATSITTAGIGAALSTEAILASLPVVAGPAALVTGAGFRLFLSAVAQSRWRFADYLAESERRTTELTSALG